MDISNRFHKNKFGITAQIDREQRDRSSHNLRGAKSNKGKWNKKNTAKVK